VDANLQTERETAISDLLHYKQIFFVLETELSCVL